MNQPIIDAAGENPAGKLPFAASGENELAQDIEAELRPGTAADQHDRADRNSETKSTAYIPHWLCGGAPHPGLIVETPGLANVAPPPITYRPVLPAFLVENELISTFQFERIIYAGQAHSQRLSNGARAAISIGDGTGTGKTTTIAGIVLDNWFAGRRRTVWFSVKTDLVEAVRDEFERLGVKIPIRLINDNRPDEDILLHEGIIFCTYKSLIAKSKHGKRRIDQLMQWLGDDGLMIFDEGHRAKYAFADASGKSTQTGRAVVEIQNATKYPNLRVVYSSATAASEVRHLAYQVRLGLWGDGTSFALGFQEFAEEIEAGGIGAMEMVARDAKAMGRYFCGNLSLGTDPVSGLAVEYREVVHRLTTHQREMYDHMARAWQEVLKNFNQALDLTNAGKFARRHVVNQFWAEHQRCFRNLITAFKVPTIIAEIEAALGAKQSVVISLTGTGEAQTLKQVQSAADEEEAIDGLDFSPRETLSRLVENCFPTKMFQEETDRETGTTQYVPVMDANGNQLESRRALALKTELIDRLSILEVPEHPLDQLVNYFGTENVAEMTGRKKRLIRSVSGRLEYRARQIPGVPNRLINLHEKICFQSKQKRIAIMSEVASTGDSLHAGRSVGNRERRLHIAAELKWSADKQVQDFGRTHRTGQVAPPIYLLVFTELGGEKRFSATIARRLANMGALTKGDRRAEKAGNLDRYNLESREGRAALNVVFTRILHGAEIPGLDDPRQTLRDMGLISSADGDGGHEIRESEKTNIPRFLNRLLSLEVNRQNALFDYFYKTFQETVEHLRANGKINDGMEDLKANSVILKAPPHVLHTDALTGAQTVYYELAITVPTRPARFDEIAGYESVYFYENRAKSEFIAVRPTLAHTDPETGDRYQMVAVSRPAGFNLEYIRDTELDRRYKLVPRTRARDWWLAEEAKIPATEQKTIHLLSGALLPIWKNLKRLHQSGLNIVRTTTDEGTRLVGVSLSGETINEIRRTFGIWNSSGTTAAEIYREVFEDFQTITLLGDAKVRRTRFQGRPVIEAVPASFDQIAEFRTLGLINIFQNGKQRFFLAEDRERALETLSRLLKLYPPLDRIKNSGEASSASIEPVIGEHIEPIRLPDWLIEPDEIETRRILLNNLLLH